jgi:hypothetical protein
MVNGRSAFDFYSSQRTSAERHFSFVKNMEHGPERESEAKSSRSHSQVVGNGRSLSPSPICFYLAQSDLLHACHVNIDV